ncbi:MAG: nucleoside recognition domain-containing protein [Roseburia sp.]
MLNYLWGFMILIGVAYGAVNGTLAEVTEAALNSSKEAVTLAITMLGVMSFWTGMMKVAENSGIVEAAAKKLRPVLRFLFPGIPAGHPASHYIAVNFIANMLGLGWAATPAGLKAMSALKELQQSKGQSGRLNGETASNEMCVFLILNISSLQLIPMNIVAYRSQYGSVSPAAVIAPGLIATCISTAVAIVFCKLVDRRRT